MNRETVVKGLHGLEKHNGKGVEKAVKLADNIIKFGDKRSVTPYQLADVHEALGAVCAAQGNALAAIVELHDALASLEKHLDAPQTRDGGGK